MAKIKEGKENISKLEETLLRLNREYGAGTILCGNTIQMEFDIVDTGSIALNAAIGIGGAPRGRIMEIVGPESSGKTTLLLELIANAQKAGIKCAMIDMEHHLSGAYAQSLGVNLDELILSQPLYGESAMKIAEELIKTKEVGLVAVDSVAALVPKSEVESGVGDPKMAGIARIGDKDSRNDTKNNGSSTVFVNGRGVVRIGDRDTRNDSMLQGSSGVFVNGIGVCRIGDRDSRNDSITQGSSDVFAS